MSIQTLQLYLKYENIHTKRTINLIENNTITIKNTFRFLQNSDVLLRTKHTGRHRLQYNNINILNDKKYITANKLLS